MGQVGFFMLNGTDAVINPTPFDTVLFDTEDQRFKVFVGDGIWRFITPPFSNFAGDADPTTGNDTSEGYVSGSLWVVPDFGKIYICTDASLGAAAWTLATGGSGGGGLTASNKVSSFTAQPGNRYFVTPNAAMNITYADAAVETNGEIEIFFTTVAYPVTILTTDEQTVSGYSSGELIIESDNVTLKAVSNGLNWYGAVSFR